LKSSIAMKHQVSEDTIPAFVDNKKTYQVYKRLFDIVGAGLGLVLLSPLFLIIALLMKIEEPKGPIIFKQTRVGKDGKEFNMYKFRSMVVNAEAMLDSLIYLNETTGAMFKMKNDPRITKLGRFIRKTSIDELPQLWNVLRGDMSLVGPRPPLPREVKEYTTYDFQRLFVIPGCTGLWQISGRSNLGFHEMVELDMEYIRKRSTLFDLSIILKTFKVFFDGKDAY
jgi:exopolysaccharide biosynthesis polyprenyl glycosylphosphotransferase